ncbi:hypothetical protein DNTS_026970 [Danionella cerebrum]|uniref:SRR1-like domain-containing protein n=1 Tax=Danionella cerebrum TaxID=2873325 RepID=A0A553N540_9TELE|nr:hypothetical protein DNTS_026970 [Danionella translucida]
MACEEWQVAGRRKKAAKRGKQALNPNSYQVSLCKTDEQKIRNAMNELRVETFWMEWKDILSDHLLPNTDGPLKNCVCYGLGPFASCVSSRYQLAMLLLLLETLQIPMSNCCVYDPVFSPSECDSLKELGFTVLTENENINGTDTTLTHIYGHIHRMLQRELERDYSFLSTVIGVCEETALPCSPRFLDVFNDTSLVCFPLENLEKLTEHTWIDPREPLYQHCQDLEIIQRLKQN